MLLKTVTAATAIIMSALPAVLTHPPHMTLRETMPAAYQTTARPGICPHGCYFQWHWWLPHGTCTCDG